MHGLRFTLDVPFECAFTKPGAVNTLTTYDIPPLTTIRGMIYSALCRPSLLNQDSHHYRDILDKEQADTEYEFRKNFEEETHIGITVEDQGTKKSDLRNRIKQVGDKTESGSTSYVTNLQTIISPTYTIHLLSENEELLSTVASALEEPARLLYLGHSDNLVQITNLQRTEYRKQKSQPTIDGEIVVPNSTGEVVNMLPIKMEDMSGRNADPSEVQTVSFGNGVTDEYYVNELEEPTVSLD